MAVRSFLFGPGPVDLGLFVLRVFAGLTLAFAHGKDKLPPKEMFVQGVEKLGFPAPEVFAWAAGLSEFLGGILLALGLLTRPAAFFVAFTMATAAFGAHASDPYQKKEMALLFMAVAVCFLIAGAGRYSIDAAIAGKKTSR